MEKLKKFINNKIESLESDIRVIKRMNYSDAYEIHQAKISALNEVLEKIQELENPVDLTGYRQLKESKPDYDNTGL